MGKETYSNKLKNPEWQKKRLEILSRDNFMCQACYNTKNTLHVHHLDYIYGKEPWEYDGNYFITLCEDCHEEVSKQKPEFEKKLISHFRLKLKEAWIQRCALFILENTSATDFNDIIYMMWEIVHNNHSLIDMMHTAYGLSVQKEIQEKEAVNV